MRELDPAPEIARLLRNNPVTRILPEPELQLLSARSRIERFSKAALLNAAHQPLTWLRLVVRGHVEVVARTAAGGEVALGDIGPGGWATWIGCFAPRPPDHDFYSSAQARYLTLPAQSMREVAQRCPELFPLVITELGARMRQLMEWSGEAVLLGPEQRIAKLLHLLARAHGTSGDSGHVQVTQARLARMARCSRQSANQLIGALERRGLVTTGYGRFEIASMTALDAFASLEVSGEPELGA